MKFTSFQTAAENDPKMANESIRVVFRVRPLNSREEADGRKVITAAHTDRGAIEIRDPSSASSDPPKVFTFDAVFGPTSSQAEIYDVCASPIVQSVLEGYNGCIFAYGQTGAGKSHTMSGRDEPSELRGIIPNAFAHIFEHVGMETSQETYLIRASYYEIYNENIIDLLGARSNKQGLELKESPDTGVYIKDLTTKVVKSVEEIDAVLRQGHKNRSVGATLMNQGSSRSHAVFSVVIESQSVDEAGVEHIRVGKLNLVDLAVSSQGFCTQMNDQSNTRILITPHSTLPVHTSGIREAVQDGRDRREIEGGDEDQSQSERSWQCHQCFGR